MNGSNVLRIALAAVIALFVGLAGHVAFSEAARTIKIVVPLAPGGPGDILARLLADEIAQVQGVTIVVENRPGAGNNIATEYVLKSDPDGYTLLLANPTNAINATYYRNLPYDFIRDSAPVAGIMRVPNVMEVSPLLSAKTVPEFITLAKANPGKLAYARGETARRCICPPNCSS